MTKNKYIRFDWAMKRLLRNKVNFGVLEGLLTTLLGERITIQKMLESESNQADEYDKYNRVDILAENSKGEIILIEVQNNNEYAYFQRMLFGTSKLVTEFISRWDTERTSSITVRRNSGAYTMENCCNLVPSSGRRSRWTKSASSIPSITF